MLTREQKAGLPLVLRIEKIKNAIAVNEAGRKVHGIDHKSPINIDGTSFTKDMSPSQR
jgi:hypothetical protein